MELALNVMHPTFVTSFSENIRSMMRHHRIVFFGSHR